MIRLISFFSLLFASLLPLTAQREHQTTWMKSPIAVDGKLTEWKRPLRYYNDISQTGYTIANDSTHLYLCFSVPIHIIQIKMIRNGFEVRIDTLGKKRGHSSITFPVGNNERTDFDRLRNQENSGKKDANDDKSTLRLRYLMQPQIMEIKGMRQINGTFNQKDNHSIKGRIDWDDQYNMIYELAIPFKEIIGRNISKKETLRNWTILFTTKAFKFDNSRDKTQYSYSPLLIDEYTVSQKVFLTLE